MKTSILRTTGIVRTTCILRIIGIACITLALLPILPTCAGDVHEATIGYFEGGAEAGDVFYLEQGYRLVINEISGDGARISIFDSENEVTNASISGVSGDYTFEKRIDGIDYTILRATINVTGGAARVAIEQHIDPEAAFDYPLIGCISVSIREGEREPLKAGYELEATSVIDNNTILTLYKNDKIVKQEKLSEDGNRRFVYAKRVGGREDTRSTRSACSAHTVLIAKLDRLSADSVHLIELSQFEEPEPADGGSGGSGGGDGWNNKLAESDWFRYLLSASVFAGMLALIIFSLRQMRR